MHICQRQHTGHFRIVYLRANAPVKFDRIGVPSRDQPADRLAPLGFGKVDDPVQQPLADPIFPAVFFYIEVIQIDPFARPRSVDRG
jgi:hypothetical protein